MSVRALTLERLPDAAWAQLCFVSAMDSPAVETAQRRSKRKLQKHNSQPRDVELRDVLCVVGGWARRPVPLETQEFQGCRMTAVSSSGLWLPQVLQGFCRTEALGSLLRQLSSDLQRCVSEAESQSKNAQQARAVAGREDLFSEGEAESSGGEHGGEVPSGSKQASRKLFREPHCISFRGSELTVAWRRKVLFVEATSKSVAALVSIIKSYTKTDVEKCPPAKAESSELDAKNENTKEIRWLFGPKSWCIHYEDEKGKQRSSSRGLAVPSTNFKGEALQSEEYMRVREDVRIKALRLWNSLDRSDRERFPVT
ncbi:unnamed protein product [Symbiodinium sp. CCMP2592]|nr:unnamed protein product [Symbiodinium sp. CCMP2592]